MLALAVILVHSDSECWVCVDQSLVSMMMEHLQFYGRFSSVKMMVLEQQLSFNEHWEWVQGDSKVDWVEFQYEKGLVFWTRAPQVNILRKCLPMMNRVLLIGERAVI